MRLFATTSETASSASNADVTRTIYAQSRRVGGVRPVVPSLGNTPIDDLQAARDMLKDVI